MSLFSENNNAIDRFGLGLAALGRPGYINLGHAEDLEGNYDLNAMEMRVHQMLDLAYGRGVRYFDAAQSYGKAEEFLSSWLRKHEYADVKVGSKWGYYYTADWQIEAEAHEIKEHTIERLNAQWPESYERLQPYLELYQIHSATFESGVLANAEVLARLAEIKSQGMKVGLSVSGVKQAELIKAASNIEFEGQLLFDTAQVTANVLEQSAFAALQEVAQKGMKIIVKEGVANGRLTSRNEKLVTPVKELSDKYAVTPDAIALAYMLHQPWVSMVLSGAANTEHFEQNIKAIELKFTEEELRSLQNCAQTVEEYWVDRSALSWN